MKPRPRRSTAYLRPNPDLTTTLDQLDPFTPNPYRPLANTLPLISASYLHERQHKRELRLESAQKGTAIAVSQQADLERTLLFSLRERIRANPASQGGPGADQGQPGVLRRVAGGEPRPVPSRRHRTSRSGPPGTAARPVRSRRADRRNQSANGQDPASDADERPHAGGAIRCHRAVRIRRTHPAIGGVSQYRSGGAAGFEGRRASRR